MLHTKGYSLLEMLVCMIIISAFFLLTLNNSNPLDLESYYFMNDYLLAQSQAILCKEKINVGRGISFNQMGHVNQARTLDFNNHRLIIHLGNGYAYYE